MSQVPVSLGPSPLCCDLGLSCSHMHRYKNADGTKTLINHTPWLGLATYNLNAYSPPDLVGSCLQHGDMSGVAASLYTHACTRTHTRTHTHTCSVMWSHGLSHMLPSTGLLHLLHRGVSYIRTSREPVSAGASHRWVCFMAVASAPGPAHMASHLPPCHALVCLFHFDVCVSTRRLP